MNTLEGKKTFIISILYGLASILQMMGIMEFPFIENPGAHLQVAISAITLRLGIGKAKA